MKRSAINQLIADAQQLLRAHHIALPPFADWSPADWRAKGPECDEIRECRLGWDITDFGSGEFAEIGLLLFTLRNGSRHLPEYSAKTYCEKLLIVRENQRTPMHYHAFKMEDIICRAGGHLVCQVYNRTADGKLADTAVDIALDGVRQRVPAGAQLVLKPGASVTLPPLLWHEFWAEPGTGTAVVGEVSKTNDDATDNFFLTAPGRFPRIEEDAPPRHLLCTEYR